MVSYLNPAGSHIIASRRERTEQRIAGYFVRVSYDEVSVGHPDAIKLVLQATLHKVSLSMHRRHYHPR